MIDSLLSLGETNEYLTSTQKKIYRSSNRNLLFHPLNFRHHFSIKIFYEEDNHVQVSPELKVNQLLQLIDLEIMGIHLDLRAVELVPRDF